MLFEEKNMTIQAWFGGHMLLFLSIYYLFYNTVHTFIQSFIHNVSPRPISISRAEPPWGAEPRVELGPVLQQAI
jgi:hypothetical protein